jgi:actin related protein 2/3 complex subunit 1A/1B
MSKAEQPIATNLVAHAWNADHSQIAIAPNTDEVWIYDTKRSDDPSKWVKIHTLAEHDGFVSGVDWCGETNTIVTCGHDRNAYVWEYKNGAWENGLVILRISRAATSVKWSPDGKKFAATSAAKVVSVASWAVEHGFWKSKPIKKGFKSTIVSLAWCPNNKFIATGSTDFKCRVHSAYLEGIDSSEDDGFEEIWQDTNKFGACLATFDTAKAWVNTVAWAPSGFRIAFAGHGGSLHIAQLGGDSTVCDLKTPFLPYADIEFLNDDTLVCGGWDMNPHIYHAEGDTTSPDWSFVGKCDAEEAVVAKKATGNRAAFNKFQSMAKRGTAKTTSNKGFLTKHQNAINGISLIPGSPAKFVTIGIDGRILFWNLKKVKDPAVKRIA